MKYFIQKCVCISVCMLDTLIERNVGGMKVKLSLSYVWVQIAFQTSLGKMAPFKKGNKF